MIYRKSSIKPPPSLAIDVKHRKHAHLVGLLTGVMMIRSCVLKTAFEKTNLCDLVVSRKFF